nr:hypothetical protein [Tissierella sp.]
MNTANNKGLKKIELDVTKKLFKYIYNNVNLNKVIEDLDKEYSYFYDKENNIAFNIWLSLDYIHKNGKTFTEQFLEEQSTGLTKKERKILEERKDSYVSLFEIIKYDKENVLVRDLLTEQNFSLVEPDLPNIIKEGEYVFSRIGKSFDNYNFIGDINYLPLSSKSEFVKNVLKNFNLTRRDYRGLTMKDYLKRFGINLYKIYDEIIFYLIDSESEFDFYALDELEEFNEFENYLNSKMSENETISHINNLSNIVEYYLVDNDKTIEDLPILNLNNFFNDSIEDGFIGVRRELMAYIKTLKLYFHFLSRRDEKYIKQYKKILKISDNPFVLIKKLNSYEQSFKIDKNLSYYIKDLLNSDALKLINDFDVFLIYIEGKVLDLTAKKSFIKREDLLQINEHLESSSNISSKAPNQRDFININFFYYLALELNILTILKNKMYFNKKAMDYLLLEDDEKYLLHFEFIQSESFVLNVLNYENDFSRKEKDDFLDRLSLMNPSKKYSYDYFSLDSKNHFFSFGRYFKLIGLMDYNLYEENSIKITRLGKKLTNYVLHNKDSKDKINIIDIMQFKR